ncbi:hypothetical protein EDD18DRAFT_1360043 [Armillaria luteobubalina]|uniref:Uncharacterized protein n=1 Tax=Armillaria luteobubalina TaxID=153913 RepID=A0AA39PPE8_9AGAR|nr:hypothetical protein EDD18DRAFT_1360043 [Armillaria luteobubalina]
MLGSDSVVGLVLFCILYGFFFGGGESFFADFWGACWISDFSYVVVSVCMPVVATLSPREANMRASLRIALISVGIAALIGNTIIGVIMGMPSTWWKRVTFALVCMIASAGITIRAQSTYVQKHLFLA